MRFLFYLAGIIPRRWKHTNPTLGNTSTPFYNYFYFNDKVLDFRRIFFFNGGEAMEGKEKKREGKGPGSGGQNRLPESRRDSVFQDLKKGHGVIETAAKHSISKSTVTTIREQHRDDLPNWKRRTARAMMETAAELVGGIREDVMAGAGNIQQKSISLGILIDKAGQLRSEPQQIVEHRHELGQTFGGWLGNSPPNSAPQRTIDAEVVECVEKAAESNRSVNEGAGAGAGAGADAHAGEGAGK